MQRPILSLAVAFAFVCLADPAITADDASDHVNRGVQLFDNGDDAKAIAEFDQAIQLKPDCLRAYMIRGMAFTRNGKYDKAIADFSNAIPLKPDDDGPYYNRAIAREGKREYDKATADYNEALRLWPNHAYVYRLLAWLQATCPDERYRDGKNAIVNADKANQFGGDGNWGYIDTLAAAYAENAQFDKAVECQKKAIELAAKDKDADKDKGILRSRLDLYKQGRPCREDPKSKQPWQLRIDVPDVRVHVR
jgi:tetratricopeptide (TPR) repeat protein